jgi:G3E family GTPase
MSVVVDPTRAARILGLEKGPQFSEKVIYVYRKQLEEANLIVVNKIDAIPAQLQERLSETLTKTFPRARVLCCSAKEGIGLETWFDAIETTTPDNGPAMELNYDTYAEGEALLGWLNCTVRVASKAPFDANQTLLGLACDMRDRLRAKGHEIAHLKMTLDSMDGTGSLSVVSLVRSDGDPDLRESLLDKVDGGSLIVNLRAEADPEFLKAVVEASIAGLGGGLQATIEHLDRFRPSRPVPVHRMSEGAP